MQFRPMNPFRDLPHGQRGFCWLQPCLLPSICAVLQLASLLLAMPALAAPDAIVGIQEGRAALLRGVERFELSEGVVLQRDDIIETQDSFVRLELANGTAIGIAGRSKVLLLPSWRPIGRSDAFAAYVLQGWAKASAPPAEKGKRAEVWTLYAPSVELAGDGAVAVLHIGRSNASVFVENGDLRWIERTASRPVTPLKAGGFAALREGAHTQTAARIAPEFLQGLPAILREDLPLRAGRFASVKATPKARGRVEYSDVVDWLRSEPGLRRSLMPRWMPLARDAGFKRDLQLHVREHPEWEPVVFPERFEKKGATSAASAASAAARP